MDARLAVYADVIKEAMSLSGLRPNDLQRRPRAEPLVADFHGMERCLTTKCSTGDNP
jgi:hypothetical protein